MCVVCDRLDRASIELAILEMPEHPGDSIEAIADRFDVDVSSLKTHAVFHVPTVSNVETGSLARNMKLHEADMLSSVCNEYMATLTVLGRRVRSLAEGTSLPDSYYNDTNGDEEFGRQLKLTKMLTKPMVDLYIGLGSEIRSTVKTVAELNRMINGEDDGASAGLKALADALRGTPADD